MSIHVSLNSMAPALVGLVVTLLLHKIWRVRSEQVQLAAIPTIGPQGFFGSYIGAIQFMSRGREMVEEGYYKYPEGAFKIPLINGWVIYVNGKKMAEDIKKASTNELNFVEAVGERLKLDYTMGKGIRVLPYHAEVVRTTLTRSIAARFPDIRDEIVHAFNNVVPATEDWTSVHALPSIMKIVTRTTNRFLVGLPLCREPEWIDLNMNYTIKVFLSAQCIDLFPTFLHPIIARMVTPLPSAMRRSMKYLVPMIEERLAKEKEYGNEDWPDKPNDLLSWLLEDTPGPEQRTMEELTHRVLAVNLAAIHTTSMAFTNTLYHLAAAKPDVVQTLREEIEEAVNEMGWTKLTMGRLWKLDSFLQETQRTNGTGASEIVSPMSSSPLFVCAHLNPIYIAVMSRKVMKDFIFSDGTFVPAGSIIAYPGYSTHHDESLYKNATTMDPFRFSKMREQNGESIRHQMVTTREEWVLFGTGKTACPGRFFAVNELKALLSHVLLTYDVKLEQEGELPQDEWYADACVPNKSAHVLFRRRQS
ncbi:hypothetical protein D9758_005367 [Tetrapyrgos nigripes]|uniref:Cytochrome P450 n=1 Tax=Tetrapyrgos nigripes TaxID=182062 RepID=A0A8H5GI16_9AGAR|nr:hypothetical protein D9758_005367 [Tetrapyrgos nigripes]